MFISKLNTPRNGVKDAGIEAAPFPWGKIDICFHALSLATPLLYHNPNSLRASSLRSSSFKAAIIASGVSLAAGGLRY